MQSDKRERIYKPWRRPPEALYEITPKAYEPPKRRVRQILKQVPLSRDRTRNWRVHGQHDSQADDNHHVAPREILRKIPQEIPQQIPQEIPQEMPQEMPQYTPREIPQETPQEIPQAHNLRVTNVPFTTPNVKLSDISALECLNEYRRNLGLGPSRNLISSGIYDLGLDTAATSTWIQYWNEKENDERKPKRKQNQNRQQPATEYSHAEPVEILRYEVRSAYLPVLIPGPSSPVDILLGLRRDSDVLDSPTPRTPWNEFGSIGSPVPSRDGGLSDHSDDGEVSPVSCLPRRCCILNSIEMLEEVSR
ncbi:hypothetical protein ANO14919_075580 [Xylariales sp. No.14919]|nr:hypothetical protein ANO14919_075580 [Xylariales sp. No.14919]